MPTDNEESGFNQRVLPRQSGQVFWGANIVALSDLRNITLETRRHLQICFVLETTSFYYWDQDSTIAESSPTIIAPLDDEGRWLQFVVVSGSMLLFNQPTQPPISEGALWWDSANKVLRLCDGNNYDTILGGSNA